MNEYRAVDLPTFQAWSRRFVPPMPPSAYLELQIPLLSAMLVTELIFPRLIEVRGCVVREDRYEQANFDNWFATLNGDVEQVERITNFFPTRGYFEPSDDVEEQALETLAERTALGWRTQAALQFPGRAMVAEVVDGGEDDGPTVLLYTQRTGGEERGRADPGGVFPRVQEFDPVHESGYRDGPCHHWTGPSGDSG